MIKRVYGVKVKPELKSEFEIEFQQIASRFMKNRPGLHSVYIGKPVTESSCEYLLISEWEDLESVKEFAGEHWEQPVIPDHMKKFSDSCWLKHYQGFES